MSNMSDRFANAIRAGSSQLCHGLRYLSSDRRACDGVAEARAGALDGDLEGSESISNGDNGAPLSRELEFADLLRFIGDAGICNMG